MFKILKVIFLGIKDIIRIKKINNKKYTAKERIEICELCEYFKPGTRQCEICWCFMDIKTKMKNKSCPEDKW